MRHDLSPARFFRAAAPHAVADRAAAARAALDAREREHARAGEWIHLRAWMRLADRGAPARAG
jgi:hypothetical protein